jgi:hypothetical protein
MVLPFFLFICLLHLSLCASYGFFFFILFVCLFHLSVCAIHGSLLLSVLFTVIPQRNNLMNVQLVYETVDCTFKNKQRMKERKTEVKTEGYKDTEKERQSETGRMKERKTEV